MQLRAKAYAKGELIKVDLWNIPRQLNSLYHRSMKSIIKHDASAPARLKVLRRNGLARRYLFSALLIALIPLVVLAFMYDTQYVKALEKVTESRTNARLAGAENLLRTFLQERIY